MHATLITVFVATATSTTKKTSKQNKLNQLCLQLYIGKTMLLLTLPLSLLLYSQHYFSLLSILLTLILLLLSIVGSRSNIMIHETKNNSMDPAQISTILGLLLHISSPLTWRYCCICSFCPLGSKFPPTRDLCLSGCLHSTSSFLLQLWLLHNLLRLLLRLHVER